MMREAVFSILTLLKFTFAAVQMPSHIWLFMTPMDCSTLGFPVLHHVSELTQTHVHWVCDAIQPSCFCCPLLLLPSVFPFIRVFSYESALHIRWPKHWSFSFSISPSSNEYSGLISFRIDWLDPFAIQGTLKSLLHHNLKGSILQHSAFFMVHLSHPYMATGKTIALTLWIFVIKVMSLVSNTLSRFVILPRSKHLLILWLHSPSALILEPK